MRRKDYAEQSLMQFGMTGLAIIDQQTLVSAMPHVWSSAQEAVMSGQSIASILAIMKRWHPNAHFIEFRAGDRAMLAVAKSLADIEQRLTWLTDCKITGVKPVQPGSLTHSENTRITELKQPVVDEFDGFDMEAFIKTLPTWSCASRADGILKLQRYWRRYPDQYRPEVYDASEKAMRTGFETELQEKAA